MSRTSVNSSAIRALATASLLVGITAIHARAQASSKADEQTLFQLENDWTQAVVKRDAAIMHRLTAPKWVYSDESGVMEREAGIKAFTTGSDTVRDASNEKMRALIYDKSAVVIGVLVMKGRSPKGAFTNRYRYTDTWAKLGGRWQCIASQDYLMPASRR
ncbi:MAG: nuclear transport factor 2 family protein [Gemmatimonadota bacterium]|nr:nuclear transport factor 2 family protein [Gemmatimonadota bacterium]